jgi:hypothetical protein
MNVISNACNYSTTPTIVLPTDPDWTTNQKHLGYK